MKEIINKPWEYILYQSSNKDYILSVICGSVATFILNIPLQEDEISQYKAIGEECINQLAAQIQYSPSAYRSRHIEIDNLGVKN